MRLTSICRLLAPALLCSTAACDQLNPSPLPPEQPLNINQLPPIVSCLALGERCNGLETGCCSDAYCEAGPYIPENGQCVAKRPDGEFCNKRFASAVDRSTVGPSTPCWTLRGRRWYTSSRRLRTPAKSSQEESS